MDLEHGLDVPEVGVCLHQGAAADDRDEPVPRPPRLQVRPQREHPVAAASGQDPELDRGEHRLCEGRRRLAPHVEDVPGAVPVALDVRHQGAERPSVDAVRRPRAADPAREVRGGAVGGARLGEPGVLVVQAAQVDQAPDLGAGLTGGVRLGDRGLEIAS